MGKRDKKKVGDISGKKTLSNGSKKEFLFGRGMYIKKIKRTRPHFPPRNEVQWF